MGTKKYDSIIQKHAISASALGAPGAFFPGIDIAGMAGIWGNLLYKIAKKSGKPFDKEYALKFATQVAGGVAAYLAGGKVFTFFLHAIPGIGTLGVVGINCGLNYIFTARFGNAIVRLFEQQRYSAGNIADVALIITAICGIPSLGEIREAVSTLS